MAASMCCVHIKQNDDYPEKTFSLKTWTTLLSYVNEWRTLDGEEKIIAETLVNYIDVHDPPEDLRYHPRCYSAFTDKTRIELARNRITRGLRTSTETSESCGLRTQIEIPYKKQKRTVGQDGATVRRRNTNVLPEQCIICTKDKYTRNPKTLKRVKEKLSSCELIAGKLIILLTLCGLNFLFCRPPEESP